MPRVSTKKKELTPQAEPVVVPEARTDGWEMTIAKALLIIITALFVYSPSFHGGWLWDDDQEITANAMLVDPDGLSKIWTAHERMGADYLPLKSTVQWLYFQMVKTKNPDGSVGTDSTPWHLLNVGLHILNALLIWKLFARLGLRLAWLGGLIFAIHPILVESVAWVSELKNTLSLPFLIVSMLCFIAYDEGRQIRYLVGAFVLFFLSLLCKSAGVMFPCVLVLFLWWRGRLFTWEEFKKDPLNAIFRNFYTVGWTVVPFFLASLIIGLVTIYYQDTRAIGTETIPVGGALSRTATAGMAMVFYTYKTLLPFNLLPIYPRWEVDPPKPWMFLAWPLVAGVLFWFWTKRKTWGKHALMGFGFFLINLIPILGFRRMSYMRITWVADHFLYLPALGLIGLVVAVAGFIYAKASLDYKKLWLVVGSGLFLLMTGMAYNYAGVFANEYEMWTYTLKSNPDAWQAHSRLGKVMIERNDSEGAFFHISESVRLRPDLAETHNNYGAMLEKKGDINGAVTELKTAAKIAPDIPIYKINLGSLLVRLRRYQEGKEVYQALVEMDPNNPTFLCNLGVAQYFVGENDAAIASFQKALKINPHLRDARDNLNQAIRVKNGVAEPPQSGPPQSQFAPPPQEVPVDSGILGSDGAIKLFGN